MRAADRSRHPARRWWLHLVLAALALGSVFFLHELSHAAAVAAFRGRVLAINVLGVQWYPQVRVIPEVGLGGYVAWALPPNPLLNQLVVVAGSTGTLLIALSAALLLKFLRPTGFLRTLLLALSFLFLDSVVHLLPVLGGASNAAPPAVRSFAESYYALLNLGVPGSWYIAAVVVTCALILALVAASLRPLYFEYANSHFAHPNRQPRISG